MADADNALRLRFSLTRFFQNRIIDSPLESPPQSVQPDFSQPPSTVIRESSLRQTAPFCPQPSYLVPTSIYSQLRFAPGDNDGHHQQMQHSRATASVFDNNSGYPAVGAYCLSNAVTQLPVMAMPSCRQTIAVAPTASTFPQQQFHQAAFNMNGASMDPAKAMASSRQTIAVAPTASTFAQQQFHHAALMNGSSMDPAKVMRTYGKQNLNGVSSANGHVPEFRATDISVDTRGLHAYHRSHDRLSLSPDYQPQALTSRLDCFSKVEKPQQSEDVQVFSGILPRRGNDSNSSSGIVNVACRSIRIGAYRAERVNFYDVAFSSFGVCVAIKGASAEAVSSQDVNLTLPFTGISNIQWMFSHKLRVLFLTLSAQLASEVRNALRLSPQDFDESSSEAYRKYLVLILEDMNAEQHQSLLRLLADFERKNCLYGNRVPLTTLLPTQAETLLRETIPPEVRVQMLPNPPPPVPPRAIYRPQTAGARLPQTRPIGPPGPSRDSQSHLIGQPGPSRDSRSVGPPGPSRDSLAIGPPGPSADCLSRPSLPVTNERGPAMRWSMTIAEHAKRLRPEDCTKLRAISPVPQTPPPSLPAVANGFQKQLPPTSLTRVVKPQPTSITRVVKPEPPLFSIDESSASSYEIFTGKKDLVMRIVKSRPGPVKRLDCQPSTSKIQRDDTDDEIQISMESIVSPAKKKRKAPADEDDELNEKQPKQLFVYARSLIVSDVDKASLDGTEYLNDAIIDFYLRYVLNEFVPPELRDRVYLFNCFFWTMLNNPKKWSEPVKRLSPDSLVPNSERMRTAMARHHAVAKWTKNVDLFSKDFIVIPINTGAHWVLAIICYPGLANRRQRPQAANQNASVKEEPKGDLSALLAGHNGPSTDSLTNQNASCSTSSANQNASGSTSLANQNASGLTSSANQNRSGSTSSANQDASGSIASTNQMAACSASPTNQNAPSQEELNNTDWPIGSTSLAFVPPANQNGPGPDSPANQDSSCSTSPANQNSSCAASPANQNSSCASSPANQNSSCSVSLANQNGSVGSNSSPSFIPRALAKPAAAQNGFTPQPAILIFDSMNGIHKPDFTILREYLTVEWVKRRKTPFMFETSNIHGYCPTVPKQDNYYDCGLYMFQYAEVFFQHYKDCFTRQKQRCSLKRWFNADAIKTKRVEIKALIDKLATQFAENPECFSKNS